MLTGISGTRAALRAQQDVEDLRRRNAQLEARVTELSQALRQLEAASRVAAVAAHDIRNALTVILGEADLLVGSLEDPEQLESARAVTSAGQIVAAIAQDMLGAARKAERRPAPEVNTAELMLACQPLILRVLKQPIEVVFELDDDLWPVAVQQQHLEAALINLSANARDAMPNGGKARIAAHNVPEAAPLPRDLPAGGYVGFSVSDTGVGMTPAVLAKATEAFFTTKARDRGTGLGLAMVKAFATEAGGALQIRTEPGRGTSVEILLPRAPPRVQPLDARDARCVLTEKLKARVRAPWLREVLQAWRDACGPRGLPAPASVEAALVEHAECGLVIAVNRAVEPPELRLIRMGEDLVSALRRTALGEPVLNGPELFGNLESAYRRALRSRRPSHQFARYSFGRGAPAQLERLILPAAVDGETVSHLVGIVLISGDITGAES